MGTNYQILFLFHQYYAPVSIMHQSFVTMHSHPWGIVGTWLFFQQILALRGQTVGKISAIGQTPALLQFSLFCHKNKKKPEHTRHWWEDAKVKNWHIFSIIPAPTCGGGGGAIVNALCNKAPFTGLQKHLSCDITKPTKWVYTQRRLRSAWASTESDQSSMCTQWVAKDISFLHADSEDWSD